MKKNNILVATNHLEGVGGSELYTYDLIKVLNSRNDCKVEYFTFQEGEISKKIEKELGVSFMKKEKYDLILANHLPVVERLYSHGPIVQICHGIVPALEQPSPYADFHVSVSKEIDLHLKDKNVNSSVFILNGLDLDKKRNTTSVGESISSVLSLCQSESANKIIEDLCKEEGWQFLAFNKHVNPTMNIEKEINKHDIVVGIGRSIYDAMACGRPCVVFDDRDYNGNIGDGYLTAENFTDFAINNCSGRRRKKRLDKKSLLVECQKYDARDGERLRRVAEKELNMVVVADKLLRLLENKELNKPFNRVKKCILKVGGRKILRLFSKISY